MDPVKFYETIRLIRTSYPDCDVIINCTSSGDNRVSDDSPYGNAVRMLLKITAYSDELDTSAFGKSHFVVDIDNKKMIFKQADTLEGEEINDFDNLNDLYNYIQNIIKGKEKEKEKNIDYSFLKKIFGSLKKNLVSIFIKCQKI